MRLECNYCKKAYWGGVTRIKNHLAGTRCEVAPCTQVPEDVKEKFIEILKKKKDVKLCDEIGECLEAEAKQEGENKGTLDAYVAKGKKGQKTMNEMLKKREPVIQDICRCIYGNALPFNLVKSPLFTKMLRSVGEYGRGLKPPSYHEARVSFLKKEVAIVHDNLEKYKAEWKKTCCTLMSDGWTDGKSRSLTNFLVNSPSGTVFLRSLDTSDVIKDAQKLFELLDGLVEEIGEDHIVQVVSDSASAYVAAGSLLEEKRKNLFWSPCAAHCLDLILKDIGELPVFYNTISKAKRITVYIYRHLWVLSCYRKYSKCKELARLAVTRFAIPYLCVLVLNFIVFQNALSSNVTSVFPSPTAIPHDCTQSIVSSLPLCLPPHRLSLRLPPPVSFSSPASTLSPSSPPSTVSPSSPPSTISPCSPR